MSHFSYFSSDNGIGAAGIRIFNGMVSLRLGQCLCLLVCAIVLLRAESASVNITYLHGAAATGALCLDGSVPAYHFDKGFGAGVDNWLVYMEGGGWCNSVETCLARQDTRLGSSKQMVKQFGFSGLLGGQLKSNPDFYNWNRVKVRYCDGSSFTGDVEAVDPTNKLYFRGHRVWQYIINDLLSRGMKNAKNAILSGCSAGGLASILHCDKFSALLPANATVKCVADAGYFLNAKDVLGGSQIESFYSQVVATHGSAKNLPESCTSRMRPELCFFPQNVVPFMQTPIFIINSAYDSWQMKNILAPIVADKSNAWRDCKFDFTKCTAAQLQTIQGFREQMISALSSVSNSTANGMFVNSCYAHCQAGRQITWSSNTSPVVSNTKIGEAVGDWFYERNVVKMMDDPYPSNPTCQRTEDVVRRRGPLRALPRQRPEFESQSIFVEGKLKFWLVLLGMGLGLGLCWAFELADRVNTLKKKKLARELL